MILQETTTSIEVIELTISKLGLTGFNYEDSKKPRREINFCNSEQFMLSCDPEYCSGVGNFKIVMGDNLGGVTTDNWGGTRWGLFYNEKTDEYTLQVHAPTSKLIKFLQKM